MEQPAQKNTPSLGEYIRGAMRNFRHQPEIYLMTFVNLLPVYGVFALGWEPLQAFGIYVMETVIVGLFHIVKLVMIMRYGKGDPPVPGNSGVRGYGLIPFFIVHYYFFVFIQLIFFTAIASNSNSALHSGPSAIPGLFRYILSSSGGAYLIIGIVLSHCFSFIMDFILRDGYARFTASGIFFQPYKRIVLQQFVVILGGFLSIFLFGAAAKGFVVLFCTLKAGLDCVMYLYPMKLNDESKSGMEEKDIVAM